MEHKVALDEIKNQLLERFKKNNISVMDSKPINYGIQFHLGDGKWKGVLRVFENKKGQVRYDYSQLPSGAPAQKVIKSVEAHRFQHHDQVDERLFGYPIIGTDESGKGDYFGPLVCAAVYVDEEMASQMLAMGVRDSKLVDDLMTIRIADAIEKMFPDSFKIFELSPHRYNQVYAQYQNTKKNLNTLLATMHAKVIKALCHDKACDRILADRFADEKLIEEQLEETGKAYELLQLPQAEKNISVAAASILARGRFLIRLAELSDKIGFNLSKGVSDNVIEQGRKIVRQYGKEKLSHVAKIHFKTTQEIL
jgi:ribonuclease HIII